jgi:hypothetical protein
MLSFIDESVGNTFINISEEYALILKQTNLKLIFEGQKCYYKFPVNWEENIEIGFRHQEHGKGKRRKTFVMNATRNKTLNLFSEDRKFVVAQKNQTPVTIFTASTICSFKSRRLSRILLDSGSTCSFTGSDGPDPLPSWCYRSIDRRRSE